MLVFQELFYFNLTPGLISYMAGNSFLKLFANPAVALLCLLLVTSVRFNRNNFLISRPLDDAAFYIANVEKIRGINPTTYPYKGPFNERVLGTTIAAFLPFSPLTAINITNLIFLVAGAWFLFRLLRDTGIPENLSWLGLYLFIFSFPTFYYSTIGYIDPTVLGCIFCGTWALFTGRFAWYILAVTAGALSKENIVLLIPAALVYAYSNKEIKWASTAALAIAIVLLINTLLRNYHKDINDYILFWEPGWSRVQHNLSRPNFYISTVLSWGLPFLICLFYVFKYPAALARSFREDFPVLTGIVCIAGATFYMIIAAFPDGRNVWVASCFPIFLAMRWWHRFGAPFSLSGKDSKTSIRS